ncbi:MAG: glycosyltransferase [bacterium]|nr:glycosyltransferase [bacterium]
MKKITILSLHLGYGGIERFITNLANSLSSDYNVEIVSTYKLQQKPFFKLNENIDVKYLIKDLKPNKDKLIKYLKSFQFIKFIKEGFKSIKILYLKKHTMINYIKNCDSDVIISTRDIHNKWLGKYAKDNVLKIGSDHNHHNNNSKYIKKIVNSTARLDYFVVVSSELKKFYDKLIKCKVIYIPNSIEELPSEKSNLNNKNIIAVGRLEKVKGFSSLIDVMDIVLKKYPDWNLNIVGDGSEYNYLNNLIQSKKLSNNIKLLGYKTKEELDILYKNSSIYVMSSLNEAFGIVLIEAMSYGLPCISFSSASGACEIIKDNITGYLIDNRDIKEMANKIELLIQDNDKLNSLSKNSYKEVQKYMSTNLKKKWIDLIEK